MFPVVKISSLDILFQKIIIFDFFLVLLTPPLCPKILQRLKNYFLKLVLHQQKNVKSEEKSDTFSNFVITSPKKSEAKSDTFFYSRTFFLTLLHQQKKVWTEEKSEEEKVNQKNLKKCGTFFFTFFHSLCNNSNKKCSKKVSLFPQSSLHFFLLM